MVADKEAIVKSYTTVTLLEKKIESIDKSKLKSLSFEIQGYEYIAVDPYSKYNGTIIYRPKSSSILYYNSFMPEISVSQISTLSEEGFRIDGSFTGIVPLLLSLLYIALFILQIFLILFLCAGTLQYKWLVVLPGVMAVFLFFVSSVTKKLVLNAFSKQFSNAIRVIGNGSL